MLSSAKEHSRAAAVDLHADLGQAPAQQAPAGNPIGEFADAILQSPVHVVDDVGIQTDTCHEQEMPRYAPAIARHMTHGDATRPALIEPLGRPHGIAAEPHLHAQHIGGAGR